jgi:5-methyltetrahydrofolate--homocysteine methyltransferase
VPDAPEVVTELIGEYLAAGADIISTNTFTATAIAQADYDMQAHVTRDQPRGRRLAARGADRFDGRGPRPPRWVAGSIGPTNRTLSMSSDVNDPGARAVDFDEVYDAYREQASRCTRAASTLPGRDHVRHAQRQGGDQGDPRSARRGPHRCRSGSPAPSPTAPGRTLSGQTVEAFWTSVRHAEPFAVGLNCALGAELMRPYLAELAAVADTLVAAYPNAGLRQHRRAHQRHRLGALPQAGERRRLRRPRWRSRASRSRPAPRSSTSTWTRACSTASRR